MPIVVRKLPNQNYYRGFNNKTKTMRNGLGKSIGGMLGEKSINASMGLTGDALHRADYKQAWNEYKNDVVGLKDGYNSRIQDRLTSRLNIVRNALLQIEKPTEIENELINAARGGREILRETLVGLNI